MIGRFKLALIFGLFLTGASAPAASQAYDAKLEAVKGRNSARLARQLAAVGLQLGSPVYLRAFKTGETTDGLVSWRTGWEMHYKESILEAWVLGDDGRYHLFKRYIVCGYSGRLGPKRREGDLQTPEGFYSLVRFRTNSNYHLSLGVSYPNGYDRAQGATGSDIYIHGDCQSIGCMALTDQQIEELYVLTWEAHQNGQLTTPIDIFPFRLTAENLERYADNENLEFWKQLKAGYDHFEKHRRPPFISTKDGRYVVIPNR